MTQSSFATAAALAGVALLSAACGGRTPPPSAPAALAEADTLVCVVDRTTERGLRHLGGQLRDGQVVVRLAGGEVPIEQLHPVNRTAGYAGGEEWLRAGEAITLDGARFEAYEGVRIVPMELVTRVGEFRTILLFADPEEPVPPEVLYVPVAPGCQFQPYVREDVLE